MTVTVTLGGGESATFASAADAVLALLPHCSPEWLGRLKRDEVGRVQRELAGRRVVTTDAPSKNGSHP